MRLERNPDPKYDRTFYEMVKQICESMGWSPRDEIVRDALDDPDTFYEQVRDRILDDHADEVFVNRCPECDHVVRTPRARLCLWCGHDWH